MGGRFQEGSGAGSGKVPGQVPGRFRGRFRTTGFGKVPGQVPNDRFREGSGSVFRTTGSRFREPRVPGRFRGRFRTTGSGKVPGQFFERRVPGSGNRGFREGSGKVPFRVSFGVRRNLNCLFALDKFAFAWLEHGSMNTSW